MAAPIDATGFSPPTPPAPPDAPPFADANAGPDAKCGTWSDDPAGDGSAGITGHRGNDAAQGPGTPGGNGSPVTLVIKDIFGGLTIDATGGRGADGQPGGKGGPGQNGGKGGSGKGCEDDKSGGRGGDGGGGGNGGMAGSGGGGGTITVLYTNPPVGVDTPSLHAAGGLPGNPGQPGQGGDPGIGGAHAFGGKAPDGSPGTLGASGPPGATKGRDGEVFLGPKPP